MTNSNHTGINGIIELGTRSSLILTALEDQFSLDDLAYLDYALLYSSEFDGPEDLHPAIPNHVAEISHRREFLPESLSYFCRRGVISLNMDKTGYLYSANKQTLQFVSCLSENYFRKIWIRLDWLKTNYKSILDIPLKDIITK